MNPIDKRSYALGVCDAFCEVVKAGVKRVALSHPFTAEELQNDLGADFPAKYGVKAYFLEEPVITDLFPAALNRGKRNIVFYRLDAALAELLAIRRDKAALQNAGRYTGDARREIAARFGRLLSYTEEAIGRYLAENTDREP